MSSPVQAPGRPSAGTISRAKTLVRVGVLVLILLVYVSRLGANLRGWAHVFYNSYYSDVVIPFYLYILLRLTETRTRFLGDWRLRASLVFSVASLIEALQALGVPLLGRTFDPLDFAMYAGGVLLAVLADRLLIERLLPRLMSGNRNP